jgi:hypothetical protein
LGFGFEFTVVAAMQVEELSIGDLSMDYSNSQSHQNSQSCNWHQKVKVFFGNSHSDSAAIDYDYFYFHHFITADCIGY